MTILGGLHMTESLLETYARLRNNIKEARESFEKMPNDSNNSMLKIHINIYQDFCMTFTENMMKAVGQTVDEVKYM
jgi:hypothetical protein